MNTNAYLIHVRSQTEGQSYLLTDVAPDEFMGMMCIKGTYQLTTSRSHYMAGRVMYIPLDKVLLVTEYESLDAYRDAVKRHFEDKAK